MSLLNSAVRLFSARRLHQIDYFRRHPAEVQQAQLAALLRKAAPTEFGKAFNFSELSHLGARAFAGRVPIQDYEQLKPYVARLRQGERDLLWPGRVVWFSKSSGTTSDKSKFIPVTQQALWQCHYQGAQDVVYTYHRNHHKTNVLSGKTLVLGGSLQPNQMGGHGMVGDISAVLMQNLPGIAQLRRVPGKDVALMAEWEQKLELLAQGTLRKNVTNLAGVPSWMLLLLKRVIELAGATHIHEVWPRLELFIHGGVSFVPYRQQYDAIADPSRMRYMETYNASEGFFAMQDNPHTDDMLLMLDLGVYFEFIPMENFHSPNPQAVGIEDVELGKNYAIAISTNAGLWRYVIGDTVMFTSLRPHKIKITGRTKHFINAFGEELIVDNAEKAFRAACTATGAVVAEYTGGPVFMDSKQQGAHEWIVEFAQKPTNFSLFVEIFDRELQQLNSDYEAKRYHNKILRMPIVHAARTGLFHDWLQQKGKLGGQNKVPRLANNRKYLDELLKF